MAIFVSFRDLTNSLTVCAIMALHHDLQLFRNGRCAFSVDDTIIMPCIFKQANKRWKHDAPDIICALFIMLDRRVSPSQLLRL